MQVRTPEEELGIFVLAWDELTQGQRDAALALGYSDDPDVVARTWPHNDRWPATPATPPRPPRHYGVHTTRAIMAS